MRRCIIRGALGLALASVSVTLLAAQAQEREIYVSLLDKDTPVMGAASDAFIVTEDGIRREVLRVRAATEPAQIALLVDTSQAATPVMQDIRKAVEAFFKDMAGPHELALITFGERPMVQVDYSRNPTQLQKGIGRLFATSGSGAYLLDCIMEAAKGLRKRDAPRPVIVAITTEGEEFSNRHYDIVLKTLRDSGAALHALILPPMARDLASDEVRNRNVVLDRGTSESGGRRLNLLSSMSLDDELASLAAEVKAQYLVTYSRPQSLLQPEKVEIKAANAALTARGTPVVLRGGGRK